MRTRTRALHALSALACVVVGTGCAADPLDVACGGVRPVLADCATVGVYHADCGGSGEPVFACDGYNGHCRWFAGACVAAGHRASDCPATDRCCHATPDGMWPFADGWSAEGIFGPTAVREDVATIGSTPVTATNPANLEVTVDPSFVPSGPPGVVCVGGVAPPLHGLCPGPVWPFGPIRLHDTFAIELRPSRNGFAIVLEVIPRADGSPLGRAFITYEEDAIPPGGPPTSCLDPGPRGVPASGTLTVDRLDDPRLAHGIIVLEITDGTVTVSF